MWSTMSAARSFCKIVRRHAESYAFSMSKDTVTVCCLLQKSNELMYRAISSGPRRNVQFEAHTDAQKRILCSQETKQGACKPFIRRACTDMMRGQWVGNAKDHANIFPVSKLGLLLPVLISPENRDVQM